MLISDGRCDIQEEEYQNWKNRNRRGVEFNAVKNLDFSRNSSDSESPVVGPTTRRKWTEWIQKDNTKENVDKNSDKVRGRIRTGYLRNEMLKCTELKYFTTVRHSPLFKTIPSQLHMHSGTVKF